MSKRDLAIEIAASLTLLAFGTLLFAILIGVFAPGLMTTGESLFAGFGFGVLLNIASAGFKGRGP